MGEGEGPFDQRTQNCGTPVQRARRDRRTMGPALSGTVLLHPDPDIPLHRRTNRPRAEAVHRPAPERRPGETLPIAPPDPTTCPEFVRSSTTVSTAIVVLTTADPPKASPRSRWHGIEKTRWVVVCSVSSPGDITPGCLACQVNRSLIGSGEERLVGDVPRRTNSTPAGQRVTYWSLVASSQRMNVTSVISTRNKWNRPGSGRHPTSATTASAKSTSIPSVALSDRSTSDLVFAAAPVSAGHDAVNEDPRVPLQVENFASVPTHREPELPSPEEGSSTGLSRGVPSARIVPTRTTPGSPSRERPSSARRLCDCSTSNQRMTHSRRTARQQQAVVVAGCQAP